MSLIAINPELCLGDGLCAHICRKVLIQELPDAVPVVAHESLCNSCGHCMLVCPSGAIQHGDCSPVDIHLINPELLPTYDRVREMIVSRRSVRTFQNGPVEREKVEKIIDGARFAPSAKNTQSTEFIVVQDHQLLNTLAARTAEWLGKTVKRLRHPLLRRIYLMSGTISAEQISKWVEQFDLISARMREGIDMVLFNAPALILFHSDKAISFAEANANLGLQNASFVAASLGLGGFYTGYLVAACGRDKTLRTILNLPKNHKVYAGLALGYPKVDFSRWIERNAPKIEWM